MHEWAVRGGKRHPEVTPRCVVPARSSSQGTGGGFTCGRSGVLLNCGDSCTIRTTASREKDSSSYKHAADSVGPFSEKASPTRKPNRLGYNLGDRRAKMSKLLMASTWLD